MEQVDIAKFRATMAIEAVRQATHETKWSTVKKAEEAMDQLRDLYYVSPYHAQVRIMVILERLEIRLDHFIHIQVAVPTQDMTLPVATIKLTE
jgi:hypothetical protein